MSRKTTITQGFRGILFLFGALAACSGDDPGTAAPGASSAGAPATTGSAVAGAGKPAAPTTSPSSVTPSRAGSPAAAGAAGSTGVVTTTPPEQATSTPPTTTPGSDESMWCGVKRTLDANCVACHNEQKTAGAPMSLKKHEDLLAPAVSDSTKKVYQVVGVRVHDTAKPMPPQQKLSASQLTGIDSWVAAGAPAGSDPTCANAPVTEPTAATATWPTDCDATYKLVAHASGSDSSPYMVPSGQEVHPKISIPAPWGSSSMQAIAFRSITDNPKVLHHWILYGSKSEFLVGWAPGKQVISTMGQSDVGMNLSGGNLTLDMHYNNLQGTSAEPDSSGVEICVLKPEHFRKNTAAVHMGFTQFAINIPPHSKGFDVTGSCTFSGNTPVTLLTASPHAHTLARHMKFTLKKASGETVVMHDGAFDFNEQQSYTLDNPLQLGKGDVVTTTCTFDNDSDRSITFGENTGNEMCFNFATYYPMGSMSCGGLGGFMF